MRPSIRVVTPLLPLAFLLVFALSSHAEMGVMAPASSDIEVKFFGSMKTFPTFMDNLDFNSQDTKRDYILDENGAMSDHTIRNEFRIGWLGKGSNWDFLAILEADFNLTKENTDRGSDAGAPDDSGMTGEDFGVEKLNLSYNFGPLAINAGWNTKALDIQTGGMLYGDDHPYLGLTGKVGAHFSWEALYLIIHDGIKNFDKGKAIGPLDANDLDWRAYTLKGQYKIGEFTLSPFYAYSDNNATQTANASVHYLGVEAYGKIGRITPRLEFVYVFGETDEWQATSKSYDISAYGAYGSIDFEVDPRFIPFVGAKYESGDDNPDDDDIDAFNGITDISRYTPTFGMENAFIYRLAPTLGTHLYAMNFSYLPKALGIARTPGYGGIGNSSSGDSPGMIMLGGGVKGSFGSLYYHAQAMYFMFDKTEGLEKLLGRPVDEEVGTELDLLVRYQFNKHFSIGNCLSAFMPGNAVEDMWNPITGNSNDETAIIDTIELTWTW